MLNLYSELGKNLEYGLKQEGLLSFVRELNGNEEEQYDMYLNDASMYARGMLPVTRILKINKLSVITLKFCSFSPNTFCTCHISQEVHVTCPFSGNDKR